MNLYEEREELRAQVRNKWKEGGPWTPDEKTRLDRLNIVHAKIIEAELQDVTKVKVRHAYSVCGWDQRHGYFRNKRKTSDSLAEALKELELAKKEIDWKIPTVIVRETFFRSKCTAMTDFDGDVTDLGFADLQEVLDKHMCGNKQYRWADILTDGDRITY